MPVSRQKIIAHQASLSRCTACPDMTGPVITGAPATGRVIQIGQAPGKHEGRVGKPFGWTAGRTLFAWYASIGITEENFRNQVYMAAVCRCFPGKNPKGGDRVPAQAEIARCRKWLDREFRLLQPELMIPVGKLAIQQFLEFDRLIEVVGQKMTVETAVGKTDCIPLPHSSGLSTWHRTEPGKSLLLRALNLIREHRAMQSIIGA